jgi:O-antigen/teichoic acid export membrane protein
VIGGKGKAIEPAKINGFVAVTNLGLSLLLVKFMGITGVALGTAIPFILASSFYIYRYCQILSIPVLQFIHQAVVPNLPLFFTSLILAFLGQKFMSNSNVFQVVAIMGIIYGITLIIGYTFLSNRNKQLAQKIIVLRA